MDLDGNGFPDSERLGSFVSPSKSKNNSPRLGVFSLGLRVFFLPGSLCSTTPIFFQRLKLTDSFLGTSQDSRECPPKRITRKIKTVLRLNPIVFGVFHLRNLFRSIFSQFSVLNQSRELFPLKPVHWHCYGVWTFPP